MELLLDEISEKRDASSNHGQQIANAEKDLMALYIKQREVEAVSERPVPPELAKSDELDSQSGKGQEAETKAESDSKADAESEANSDAGAEA